MESPNTFIMMLLALMLRVGLPVIATLVLVSWLRSLDNHWQKQAEEELARIPIVRPGNTGCWKTHGCSPDARAKCKAFQHQESPCWQVFRQKDGKLRENCINCEVFRGSPIPVVAGD